jgi:hypothetical protein
MTVGSKKLNQSGFIKTREASLPIGDIRNMQPANAKLPNEPQVAVTLAGRLIQQLGFPRQAFPKLYRLVGAFVGTGPGLTHACPALKNLHVQYFRGPLERAFSSHLGRVVSNHQKGAASRGPCPNLL